MYGRDRDELGLPMDTQLGFTNHLSAAEFRAKLRDAETGLNGNVPLLVFDNHDNPRSFSRYGDGKHDMEIAKLLATLLLTPRDAALLYYGAELGMRNNDPKRREDVRDPIGKLGWPKTKGRDGERTPMQWTAGTDAGFSIAQSTWLPVGPDYKTVNVAVEEREPNSLLNYYKTLIHLRKDNPQLRDGDFVLTDENNQNVLSYLRKTPDGKAVLVALNFTAALQTAGFDLRRQGIQGQHVRTVLASFPNADPAMNLSKIVLPAYGGYIGEIER